tara:strand:+ start:116 stop:505 length:390 start_codon:yes stop_codon:yes gene_type:complete
MNRILVEISIGELLDKISILEIKSEKIKDNNKLNYIKDECKNLKDQLNLNVEMNSEIENLYKSLKEINLKLWTIEDEKRLCERNLDFGEKFIKLSRDVHFMNDKRAKVKLEINDKTGSKIKEVKEYTQY